MASHPHTHYKSQPHTTQLFQKHEQLSAIRGNQLLDFQKKNFWPLFCPLEKNWILLYKNLTEKCSWTHHNVPKKIKSAQINHQQYLYTYNHCRIPHNCSKHTLPLHFWFFGISKIWKNGYFSEDSASLIH